MPRTLPWLSKSVAPKADVKSSSPAPKRRKRESSPENLVDTHLNDIATPPPRPKQKKRADRTPSTSPVRASSDVEVDYMRDGYNADDLYLMVEDEFQAVAKEYSKHLHTGEWLRLKKLAKSRGEKTLSAVDHGTDGRTDKSTRVQMEEERRARERKRKDALGEGSDSEEELPFMQDPQLAGLMGRDGRVGVGRELAGVVKAKSKTRAAMGFMESPHAAKRYHNALEDNESECKAAQKPVKATSSRVPKVFEEVSSDDEEDDLDVAPAVRRPASHRPEPIRKTQANEDTSIRRTDAGDSDNVFKHFASSSEFQSSSPNDKLRSSSTLDGEVEEGYDAAIPQRVRPTYKKAQNRQQAAQALSTQAAQPERSPLRSTGTENGLFKRSLFSSSTSVVARTNSGRPASAVHTTSPTKTFPSAQSQGTKAGSAAGASYLARRAAERERKEKEQQGQARQLDDIPTFLC